jgi:hypothetical protein
MRCAKLVAAVLATMKDPAACVAQLSPDAVDVLVKYLYKGLSAADNSQLLLKWHAAALQHGGMGCVVRAISSPYA